MCYRRALLSGLVLGLVLAVGAAPLRADFQEGLAAYDAGDFAAAEAWRPLAAAGDVEAQVALAGLYTSGLGVPTDPTEAARLYRAAGLYRAAAEQGDAVARLNLGDAYSRGAGVPRDPVRAYVWLSLAAEQGRNWARNKRDEIAERLTAGQRVEAERLLAEKRASE